MKYLKNNVVVVLLFLLGCNAMAARKQIIAKQIAQLNQSNTHFTSVNPFVVSDRKHDDIKDIVKNASFAKLNLDEIARILKSKPEYITLDIPYQHELIRLQLYRVNVTTPNFRIEDEKGKKLRFTHGVHYRGIIKGETHSIASFSFFEDEVFGIISANVGFNNLVIGKLKDPDNDSDYIIYSDLSLSIEDDHKCTLHSEVEPVHFGEKGILATRNNFSLSCINMYHELSYKIFVDNDRDTIKTTNYLVALFNNVQTIFENDSITIALKSATMWTVPDPYISTNSDAFELLNIFKKVRPVFDGDAGQLLFFGGGIGLAYLNGLCSNDNRSYCHVNLHFNNLPLYSGSVKIMSHELGHVFGTLHTHGCYWNGNNTAIDGCSSPEGDCERGPIPNPGVGGTIMSYCGNVNFANGFGDQPRQRMLDFIASTGCFGADCDSNCMNTLEALDLLNTTFNSATIAWEDDVSEQWNVGYAPFGDTIVNWQVTQDKSMIISGLESNKYYTVGVQKVCKDSLILSPRFMTFCTGADWCSGEKWTDTGGSINDYTKGEYTITIIKPQVDNQSVNVTLNKFSTQFNLDELRIYDGIGTQAPLLFKHSGSVPPNRSFQSTNEHGALTFEFMSHISTFPSDGWSASVECIEISNIEQNMSYFNIYPNPVNESLTITSSEMLNGIKIINITGQILWEEQFKNIYQSNIEMSSLPSGLYFLEIKVDGKSHIKKIVKQ